MCESKQCLSLLSLSHLYLICGANLSILQSRLSAKAQRKVVREIKTARVLGLMPFTSMGQAPFRFMRSRLDDNGAPQGSEY